MIGLFLSFLYYPSVNFIDVADLTRIIVYKGKADKKKINKIIRPLFNSAFFSFWPNSLFLLIQLKGLSFNI